MRQEGSGWRALGLAGLVGLVGLGAWLSRHVGRERHVEEEWRLGADAYRSVRETALWGPETRRLCRLEGTEARERWCRSLDDDETVDDVLAQGGLVLVWAHAAGGARFWLLDAADGGNVHRGALRSGEATPHALVVTGDLVLVAEPGPTLTAIALPEGAQRWSVPTPAAIAAIDPDGAALTLADGARYALDATRGALSRSDAPSDP